MIGYVILGAAFGFALSRAGATDADAIHNLFLLRDLHLAGVMIVAIAALAFAFAAFRRGALRVRGGGVVKLEKKPMQRGVVIGGLLFGAGWAVTGACPGTVLAQIGEGTLPALVTFAGILIGARLQRGKGQRMDLPGGHDNVAP